MGPNKRRVANLEQIRAYFDLIASGDVDALARYWHDEIVFEAPFSFTGKPSRATGKHYSSTPPPPSSFTGKPSRTTGKQEVYERLSTSYGLVSMAFHITEVYELIDPDCFLVEYDSDGHMLGSGERYQNSYITLVEMRDGLISRFREFYDSQRCAAAFGPLLDPDH